jgi:uncharacterized protein (TIGR02391 family)
MVAWYLNVSALLREMRAKAFDALTHMNQGNSAGAETVNSYLAGDYSKLKTLWLEQGLARGDLDTLGRHISFGEVNDYQNILRNDISTVEMLAENHALARGQNHPAIGFESLLHPIVTEKALAFYADRHYREAVLNSVIAVFDVIRARTGLKQDGAALVSEALSVDRPRLVLSELTTESGCNDQIGFMQIIQGMYKGIRNPKAHSLQHDLDEHKAAQYMVLASLVMRRITDATIPQIVDGSGL